MKKSLSSQPIVLKFLIFLMCMTLIGCDAGDLNDQEEIVSVEEQPTVEIEMVEERIETEGSGYRGEISDPELVDDFESVQIVTGKDIYAEIGFVTWSDGSEINLEVLDLTGEIPPPEGLAESTGALALSVNIGSGGWAGMTHQFANAALDEWITEDWSAYEGISFWVYGQGTEGTLLFEVLDNRNPDSEVDDAERWNFTFYDDFSGWKQFEVPFTDFKRKDIGNGAPNDGMELVEVHGYAFGGFGATAIGAQTYFLDDVRVYGIAPEKPVLFNFSKQTFQAKEGGRTKITIVLNKPAEVESSVVLSIAEAVATPGEDFLLETGPVVFAVGEMEKSIEIIAIDDLHAEGNEQFVVTLSNPEGVQLGPKSRAVGTIRDNDSRAPGLIFDFETYPGLVTSPGVTLALQPVGEQEGIAFEGQVGSDTVLKVRSGEEEASFESQFAEAQNWGDQDGIQFWMYGQNSGGQVNVDLQVDKIEDNSNELTLVWSDEFDRAAGESPDFFIWQPELGDGRFNNLTGWGNAELEHYTSSPENAAHDGTGNLVITAREVDPSQDHLLCWYGPCEYTSARLITKGKHEFQYGRIEARMKMPEGYGLWPAFWMLGSNIDVVNWPQSGEIDIVEHLGRMPNKVVGALHGPGYSGVSNLGTEYPLAEGIVADDFHVFAVEWLPRQIVWFIDEIEFHSVTPDDLPEEGEWVFDKPGFIILNLAVGGHYPGNPTEDTPFPAELVVDYVRVYQNQAEYQILSTMIPDDFEGWKLIQIPFADFEGQQADLDVSAVWGFKFSVEGYSDTELLLDDLGLYTTE